MGLYIFEGNFTNEANLVAYNEINNNMILLPRIKEKIYLNNIIYIITDILYNYDDNSISIYVNKFSYNDKENNND